MTHDSIYLDHAATTPLRPEAAEAMRRGFAIWANPSSPHKAGRAARAALEDARTRVKAALNWDGEVIFTSGASEAALLPFDRADVLHEVVSAVEHDAIQGFIEFRGIPSVPVSNRGDIDLLVLEREVQPSSVAGSARENRTLAAIQHVNSETGNRQDIVSIAAMIHSQNGLLLVDCAQSAGKIEFPDMADMAIISAHKFGGPVGIGALLVKDFAMLIPNGGQERGYRRGTENLPGALGMVAALEACTKPYVDAKVLEAVDRFAAAVRAAGGVWLSDHLSNPTAYIHAIAMPGLSGQAQLVRFDMAGIAVSQGSACSSGSMRRSHVLTAMGIEDDLADRTIRMSLGWTTTIADIERFAEVWLAMARAA